MKFIKAVIATIVGIFLFNILVIFVILPILGSLGGSEDTTVKSNSILQLKLSGQIAEISNDVPFTMPVGVPVNTGEEKISLSQLLNVIHYAKTDKNIKGIYLNVEHAEMSTAANEQIAQALTDFKTTKKFVYAYGSQIGEGTLLLHKIADKSYINPVGIVEFNGMGGELMFFTGLLEKLGVEPMIFYAGNFKSATEPFRLKAMSEENRLQTNELLNDIYGNYLARMSKATNVAIDSLRSIADSLKILEPSDAVKYKLADGLRYEQEVWNEIKTKMGYKNDHKLNIITYKDYLTTIKPDTKSKNKIAVLYAEGEIVGGKGEEGTISDEVYVKYLKEIQEDESIKALVLRVNSPGGSSYASEQIWYMLNEIKKKIPVVVSMGDVAASGGYYISTASNKIYANASTITGSIGVFGMLFNIEKAANSKLGITFDRVTTGPYADFGTATRPWTELEKNAMTKSVMNVYSIFKKRVADNRKMSLDAVEQVAQGRVWSGIDAKANGLVDEIGDLDDAIAEAKKLAKLDKATIVNYPTEKTFVEKFISSISTDEEVAILKQALGENYYLLKYMQQKDKPVIQMMLPYRLEIK